MESEKQAAAAAKTQSVSVESGEKGNKVTVARPDLEVLKKICGSSWIDASRLVESRKSATLGEGGFGTVKKNFLEMENGSDNVVAVKTLKQDAVCGQAMQDLILEATTMTKIKHPCIVELLGVGTACSDKQDAPNLFLVMEYMDRGSLQDLLWEQMDMPFRKLYSDADLLRWCLQIARALSFLHSAKPLIIHRDIKPANILLKGLSVQKSEAKLTDFGLLVLVAKPMDDMVVKTMERINSRDVTKQDHALDFSALSNASSLDKKGSLGLDRKGSLGLDKKGSLGLDKKGSLGSSEKSAVPGRQMSSSFASSFNLTRRGSTTKILRSATLMRFSFSTVDSADRTKYQLTGCTGSLLYMAPEVFRHEEYNEKVDIFSLGMIMYELFMREPTFYAMKCRDPSMLVETYVEGVCLDGKRPLIPARIPEENADLIRRCWSDDPQVRPSAKQLVEELRDFMANHGIPETPAPSRKFSLASSAVHGSTISEEHKATQPCGCHCVVS